MIRALRRLVAAWRRPGPQSGDPGLTTAIETGANQVSLVGHSLNHLRVSHESDATVEATLDERATSSGRAIARLAGPQIATDQGSDITPTTAVLAAIGSLVENPHRGSTVAITTTAAIGWAAGLDEPTTRRVIERLLRRGLVVGHVEPTGRAVLTVSVGWWNEHRVGWRGRVIVTDEVPHEGGWIA